ncbi:hypothetical protein AAE250_16790 [Bacteroides sp. GD17]|uniref:hypothetical protein n=1 Tax=Bacteroides sp. GD17 TaxID=3139826 RepID=UPI00313B81AA
MMKISNCLKCAALIAAFVAAATGCTNEDWTDNPQDGQDGNEPKTITLRVSMPGNKNDAQTRVAYDDDRLELTWQKGDQLRVEAYDRNGDMYYYDTYTYEGEDGAPSADFEITIYSDAATYDIYYSPSSYGATQIQTADKSTDHLKKFITLGAEGITETELEKGFTLQMKNCIMKFELSGIPDKVGKLKQLQWSASNCVAQSLYFAQDAVTFDNKTSTLTAFLSFEPAELPANGSFSVSLVGDKVYTAKLKSTTGKKYEEGHRYTATIIGNDWQTPSEDYTQAVMSFKIKTNAANETFFIPFPTSGSTPAGIKVKWEEGGEEILVPHGTGLSSTDAFKHTYEQAGEYTITISSNQPDATMQQIPEMNFYWYRNSYTGTNRTKLLSIETPLLNTGVTDFGSCFRDCSTLKSVSGALFTNNTKATDFSYCFYGCSVLENIPGGLFALNTEATNFEICFYACSALQSIPPGLFDKNTKATNFGSCFSGCSALQSIPTKLFDKNMEATNFPNCFYECKKATLNKQIFCEESKMAERFAGKKMNFDSCFESVGSEADSPGKAPELWKYAPDDGTWSTWDCFEGAYISNADPQDGYHSDIWGTPKTK